jgi:glycerophosphoryl diester phosphodiesterase
LAAQAHAAGLQVHAWTFHDDARALAFATGQEELEAAFALGVDALFCDFPDTALAARARWLSARR